MARKFAIMLLDDIESAFIHAGNVALALAGKDERKREMGVLVTTDNRNLIGLALTLLHVHAVSSKGFDGKLELSRQRGQLTISLESSAICATSTENGQAVRLTVEMGAAPVEWILSPAKARDLAEQLLAASQPRH